MKIMLKYIGIVIRILVLIIMIAIVTILIWLNITKKNIEANQDQILTAIKLQLSSLKENFDAVPNNNMTVMALSVIH